MKGLAHRFVYVDKSHTSKLLTCVVTGIWNIEKDWYQLFKKTAKKNGGHEASKHMKRNLRKTKLNFVFSCRENGYIHSLKIVMRCFFFFFFFFFFLYNRRNTRWTHEIKTKKENMLKLGRENNTVRDIQYDR